MTENSKLIKYRVLDGNALKLIAILAMTADHLAWLLFPGYDRAAVPVIMHIIGRLTCPVMCFFIAEGYHYTHSKTRYALRLLLLAVASHSPTCLPPTTLWIVIPLSRFITDHS